VHLQADPAVERNRGILLGVVEGRDAVDPRLDPRPLGADPILVPVVRPHARCSPGIDRFGDHLLAARLVVQLAPPLVAGVHLVADHLVALGSADAANLDAGVHETLVTADPECEPEVEILERFPRADERVVRHRLGGRAADDRPVGHLPPAVLTRADLPAFEAPAVEQRPGGRFGPPCPAAPWAEEGGA